MAGGCLGGAQAPPATAQQANMPHFHQFEPFSSNLFDKFGSFDEFGGDLVGKRCCSWAGQPQAKSRREGIRRQKSLARCRLKFLPMPGTRQAKSRREPRAQAKPRREGSRRPKFLARARARLRTRIIKVIPIEIFVHGWDSTFPCPCQARARRHFAIREAKRGCFFRFFGYRRSKHS